MEPSYPLSPNTDTLSPLPPQPAPPDTPALLPYSLHRKATKKLNVFCCIILRLGQAASFLLLLYSYLYNLLYYSMGPKQFVHFLWKPVKVAIVCQCMCHANGSSRIPKERNTGEKKQPMVSFQAVRFPFIGFPLLE